jgi:hypothetical protein
VVLDLKEKLVNNLFQNKLKYEYSKAKIKYSETFEVAIK